MPTKKQKRGEFFSVDRSIWAEVCNLGQLNAAAAYLTLAQGTSRGKVTCWSVESLRKYTGMRWERGKASVETLTRCGFIRPAENSTVERPRYELVTAGDFAETAFARKCASMTGDQRNMWERIRDNQPLSRETRSQRVAIDKLIEDGIILEKGYRSYAIADPPVVSADPIWLPNSVVVGAKGAEDAPVRRLRMAGDIWVLRLLIELYYAHNLRDDGGISPKVLRWVWERRLVGEQGIYRVWGFRQRQKTLHWDAAGNLLAAHLRRPQPSAEANHPIWASIENLEKEGLLTFVPHLWTGDPGESDDAELLHPYGLRGFSEAVELDIATAAHQAGLAMVPDSKREPAEREGFRHLVPVVHNLPNVQMVGMARLRYRPHTARTSQWYSELTRTSHHWLERYKELRERAERAQPETIWNQKFAVRC